jgi:hypothetical protein
MINLADNCCCSHGARCSCALKKEHLDPVPESDSDEAAPIPTKTIRSRPRALTAQSDTGLTVFTNGHHKPVHRNNTMAHKCGLPYVVPRAHSIHGPSPGGLANRSVDNLPHTNTIEALHSDSHIKDSMVSAQQEQRMVKSEHGSPVQLPASNLDILNGQLTPLDLSSIPTEYNFLQNFDNFSAIPDEQPIFSAGLSASVDWSHYDLDFSNDNFASSSYSQAPSFNGFDFSSIDQPALTTTSTSGEVSEVEDPQPLNDIPVRPLMYQKYGSDFDASDFGGDIDSYQLSTTSSYIGLSQAQILCNNSLESDIDAFLGKSMPATQNFTDCSHGFPATSYTEDDHSGSTSSPYEDEAKFQLMANEEENDWMNSFTGPNSAANCTHNEPLEETFWVQ